MVVKFDSKKLHDERRRNFTQEVFAEEVDITVRYLRDLEHGVKSNPSGALLCRMCTVLNLSLEDLMIIEEDTE